MATADEATIRAAATTLRADDPFLYTALNDTLFAAAQDASQNNPLDEYRTVVEARAEALLHWNPDGNETIQAIRDGSLDPDEIKPHVRFESAAYDAHYAAQSENAKKRGGRSSRPFAEADFAPLPLGRNVNHAFRNSHAVALVESIFGLMAGVAEGDRTMRWMDIGCGTGDIANAVNPGRYAPVAWEIVGCDFQEGRIDVANKRKAKGRTFIVRDAFDVLNEYGARGLGFDLVSMFEFLEHLEDPYRLIKRLRAFNPTFVVAGSPLEQVFRSPRHARPDPVHLWSFSRNVWQRMFTLAGFEVVFSSEVRVGTYIGGLDWLSIICGPRDLLRQKRQDLQIRRDHGMIEGQAP